MTGGSHRPGSASPAGVRLPPLYPIIDIDLCRLRGIDPVAFASRCIRGGARLLQVRQKDASAGTAQLLRIVRAVIAAGGAAGARVIVNDRSDIAAISRAAGVHVGQQDLAADDVRAIVGPDAIVGLSTHTEGQIEEASQAPVDYIAVGPVFRTSTKDTGYDPRGLEMVRKAARTGRPVVAIGGITLANARGVLDAGAASVAIISDLISGDDPERRVRDFLKGAAEGC